MILRGEKKKFAELTFFMWKWIVLFGGLRVIYTQTQNTKL